MIENTISELHLFYSLYFFSDSTEIEAQKHVHQFLFYTELKNALTTFNIRKPTDSLISELKQKAIEEIEVCLSSKPISAAVRLAATICYARELSNRGLYEEAWTVATNSLNEPISAKDKLDPSVKNLLEVLGWDMVNFSNKARQLTNICI
jgi:hypothetical protein